MKLDNKKRFLNANKAMVSAWSLTSKGGVRRPCACLIIGCNKIGDVYSLECNAGSAALSAIAMCAQWYGNADATNSS